MAKKTKAPARDTSSGTSYRKSLGKDEVPAGHVPVNNGNPNSPRSVPIKSVIGKGTNLTADNSPLPPTAVNSEARNSEG